MFSSPTKIFLLISLACLLPALTAEANSHGEDDKFLEAVKAVKEHNYSQALALFEPQANAAKHDAQYNMAVLLQAGKGRPRNYPEALYWSWLAQLGGIEEAEDISSELLDKLTGDDIKAVQLRVGKSLQARLDHGDIMAISQFGDYHLSILEEPDYNNAYIWYSIAVALNIPKVTDQRDNAEDNIEEKEIARLQNEANKLFEKYKFKSFTRIDKGG